MTLQTLLYQQPPHHSPLVSTLTTLSIFLKTLWSNRNLKPFFPSSSPLNLWGQSNGSLAHTFTACHTVHFSQAGFTVHLVEDDNIHTCNVTPNTTPYRSGLPINAIPKSDKAEDCPTLIEKKRKYQSVIGLIGWLAQVLTWTLLPYTPSSWLITTNHQKSLECCIIRFTLHSCHHRLWIQKKLLSYNKLF